MGAFYEAYQRGAGLDARDFQSTTIGADLWQRLAPVQVALGGQFRSFDFKPIPNFGFSAPMLTFQLRWHHSGVDAYLDEDVATEDVAAENVMGADWDVTFRAQLERRQFEGLVTSGIGSQLPI